MLVICHQPTRRGFRAGKDRGNKPIAQRPGKGEFRDGQFVGKHNGKASCPSHVRRDCPRRPWWARAGTLSPRYSRCLRLFMSSKTAWAGAGSGEVPGWTLLLRLPARESGAWLFHGVRPGRVPWRGVAQEGSAHSSK